ncbi:undecaprenyl pyrophosphate phosphatase [Serratia symbiotica str. 'Cinara cedri']|nr:undecaprenyl pyrophosphate phosphatase [Serratia symbiotica str. 'Cinara cedri']
MVKILEQLNYLLFSWINANLAPSKWLITIATFLARDTIFIVPLLLISLWAFGPQSKLLLQREVVTKTIIALLFTMITSAAIGKLLPHQRPFAAGIGYCFLAHKPDTSFPSNHGAAIFTIALAFLFWYRIWLSGILISIAIGIAWSRVYLGIHWPLDMLASFFLGLNGCLITQCVWTLFGDIITTRLINLYHFLFISAIRKGWLKA